MSLGRTFLRFLKPIINSVPNMSQFDNPIQTKNRIISSFTKYDTGIYIKNNNKPIHAIFFPILSKTYKMSTRTEVPNTIKKEMARIMMRI